MMNNHILKHVHKHGFSEGELFDAYKIFFGTLVSESRLRMINLLRKDKAGLTVSQIMDSLSNEQSSVSHDLARLKKCGFVNVSVEGKFRRYSLNSQTIIPLMDLIDDHMSKNCVHILHGMNHGGNR